MEPITKKYAPRSLTKPAGFLKDLFFYVRYVTTKTFSQSESHIYKNILGPFGKIILVMLFAFFGILVDGKV